MNEYTPHSHAMIYTDYPRLSKEKQEFIRNELEKSKIEGKRLVIRVCYENDDKPFDETNPVDLYGKGVYYENDNIIEPHWIFLDADELANLLNIHLCPNHFINCTFQC